MGESSFNPALALPPETPAVPAEGPSWSIRLLEIVAAAIMFGILVLLFTGVAARYAFASPITWIDEVVSALFLWLAMVGSVLAMYRNEHLRLTLFLSFIPGRIRRFVEAFAIVSVAAFLVALLEPSFTYAQDEWFVTTPGLGIPNTYRVAAIGFGLLAMLGLVARFAVRTTGRFELAASSLFVAAVAALCWWTSPALNEWGTSSMVIFLVGFVLVFLAAGVPIGFCFGLGALTYLAFATQMPLAVIIGRMDEGMSSLVLVSVPIFVLLGCLLDSTGMGRAIVGFLSSLIGHLRAGMSYVLLGSLFIVSGISGSKVSDMATVAPALFPEMSRRGYKRSDMTALLATGAAMADTVPPSIVLIVLGSVASVSIAALFQSGFVIAMVLLLSLLVLVRWKARSENRGGQKRQKMAVVGKLLLVAAPALVLPFLIRSAVGGGIATTTEVSTVAVLYALLVGHVLYGGIGPRKVYTMLVETAALSGAILLILGTASAMAWSITQSGVVQQLSTVLANLPGGWVGFMVVSVLVFLILGCLLEGLPAILLLAPIMFPIAKTLGIHEVHYAMVAVSAMNIGLMMPPIGIGFYVACKIGDVSPDEVMTAIWPYLFALLAGLAVIVFVPWLSLFAI